MESEHSNQLNDPAEEAPAPDGIAIVGMAGRFPGAADISAFWRNLREGVESISVLSREELAATGVEPALLEDPRLIPAGGILDGVETFDAAFFGFGPREAEAMDPQLRLFLEVAWEAFEHAGYDSEGYSGSVGIFGGMGASNYLIRHLLAHPEVLAALGPLQARILTDKDFLVSLAAFKMNLTGPSINVQTACSTSLVATVLACQSLVTYQCDVALAGGSTILLPQAGYLPMEGVSSPDGRCRAFDARSQGTVGGSGAGVVVLKRLADALAEGDTVHAVIKGFATNNDGSFKMGYTAPGIEGQIQVVAMAQAVAGIRGDSITYVEAHGTGTPLGDPIEVDALTEVFRSATDRTGYCALGSVKSNIGHLDSAAGVASLIKTTLALEHRQIPASLGFEIPNPQIDFSASPFFVNTELRDWTTDGMPRRAGVSSFAIGGVNAHVVLEEAPPVPAGDPAGSWQLLVLSARTETALEAATNHLIHHLEAHPEENLADVAYTLQVGRRAFRHRRALVCCGREDAIAALEARDPRRLLSSTAESRDARPAFLFPGLGNHHVGMARDLYREEPRFREVFDECADLLTPELGLDLRQVLYPEGLSPSPLSRSAGEGPGVGVLRALLRREASEETPAEAEATRRLRRTELAQPAVFAVEYALARLLMDMGLKPEAMLGFSVGEYVAACLSGVFELRDALRLVARRAKLISELPSGGMLAVPLSEVAAGGLTGTELSIAAVLGPELTVLAGPEPAVAAVEARLSGEGLQVRRLETEHAFHSRMMDPIAGRFRELFRGVRLQAPEIPFLSNVSGTWITPEQATDPGYWVDHLRKAVRFADGVAELWREPGRALIEAGPGQTLTSWALQHPSAATARDGVAVATMRHALDRQDDLAFLLSSLARLWLAGVRMDWTAFWAGQRRLRVPLPTYPFERQRYWLEPGYPAMLSAVAVSQMGRASMDEMRPEAVAEDARKHLPMSVAGARVRPELPVPYTEPRSEVERLVVLVWKDLLGIDRIGIWDGFFDLGGDSILATKLVTRLNEAFAAGFSLRSVFEKPTVADMAAVILARRAEGDRVEEARIPRIPRVDENGIHRPLPVSFAQRRLWFLDQLAPGDPFYNVPAAAELSSWTDPGILALCFLELIRRHETLRTRLVTVDGEPYQEIEPPPASWTLPLVDLEALPAPVREAEGLRLAREEARTPFDLSRAPMLRTLLLRLEERRHVICLTMHHVISDGWSNVVFLTELAEMHRASLEGRPASLPELPIQYADFAAWQQDQLEKGALAEQLAWWRGQLTGLPPELALPTDRPRPAVQTFGGKRIAFVVEPDVAEELRARAREEGATLYMLLLAAMDVLLYRHTNQTLFAVGSVIANRTRPETENLIGFFTNTIVLRAEVDPSESFRGLLRRTRDTARQAFQYQDVPFEKLVEELQPQRDLSRSAFFQVMMIETLVGRRMLDDLGLRALEIDPGVARFDFLFDMSDQGHEVTGILEYNSDLFDDATAERIVRRWRTLLAAVAANGEARVGEVRMLPAEEWAVIAGSAGILPAPGRPEEEAGRMPALPAGPAVVDLDGSELTYAELHARANQLAHWLRRQGVGPDIPVALSLPRSAELLVSLLAIREAGGAYVPLDPEYPVERRAFGLRDSGASLLLTRPELAAELPSSRARIVDLGSLDLSAVSRENLPQLAGPENLAYLLYTSGSTGRPKGVGMTRGALDNLIAWQAAVLPGAWRTLQFTSFNFDVSYQEIFSTWAVGGTLVLISEEDRRDPERLLAVLRERQVERLFLPFVALQQLAEAAVGHPLPTGLREVITAGEQLRMTPALVELFRRLPGARLHNHYGPTESHVVTAFTLDGDPAAWPALPPIGRQLPGTRALVLDPHGGPAPLGVPGELYLGGVCLARGYLNRPDLTADRFRPDPTDRSDRLYRTGDRARLRADGVLEYLGRIDDQVKIRGYRVEPGGVEAAIAAHPGVSEAVVGIRESADGSRRLVAWVVPRGDQKPDDLRAFLAERLPEYEVPSAIVLVESFPRTPSGKVDRRRLLAQAPVPEIVETAAGYVEPRTATEELLAGIWAEVLELPRVGVEDDFFALGGHSLLATRITARVRALFGISLPVRALFEASTVTRLAARIEAESREKILTEWLPAAAPLDGSPLLHERFAEQARRTPDAPALRDSSGKTAREMSYRELDLRSDLLAADLIARGVLPGARVGVGLGRSAEAVVAILGILKAGAAWLPLDPSLPEERRTTILEDAGLTVLVDRVDLDAAVSTVSIPHLDLPGSALAYILYTSGSTGRPKGVCCTHVGAVNLVEEMQRQSPLPPGTVCSQWASLSFDASILEIFSAFFAGGCLDIVPESLRTDMPALAAWMAGRGVCGVGSVFLPPALLADFAEAIREVDIPLLRLQAGGEAVPVAPLEAMAAHHPEAVFFDCYGPTEAAITATLWSLPAEPPQQMWAPIGRPFANVRAYVLGPEGQPVPAGVAGELFLAGLCLAHGYLGRPDLTAERFLPDPFAPDGERMYRTGDLARWSPDGILEFLGRLDHQVKVRGFRIELGEVEAALLRCPGVVEAVALAPEREGGRRLEAFVVAPETTGDDLRSHLAAHLPGYMIPSSLVVLPSLPRTAGGKVDRRRLAELTPEAVDVPAAEYVAPRTPQEVILAGVWAEVLGIPRVGVHDDFFLLGGHSLLATRVVSRVQKLFGVSLPVRSLFEAPTLEQLAARIGAAEAPVSALIGAIVPPPMDERAGAVRKPAGARASIPRVPRDRPLPLSFAQERIWFLEQLKPGTTAYHLPASLDLRGALDLRALAAALAEILRRHEALRTVFHEEGGMPVQHVLPPPPPALPLIDLQGLPVEARDAEAGRLAAAWFQRPFDLRGEPMLRAGLLGLQPDLHRLLLLQHHIASDGWSFGVLLREVVTFYPWFAGLPGGAQLPELPIQYADFAVWQREQLQGEELDRLVDAWRERLAGAPPATDLPTDRPRPPAQEFHGENLTTFYGQRSAINLLGALARSEKATLFMVLLAVFETLLQRWSGADDVVVGTPVAGRQRPELEGLIGVFINTLALRGRLDGEPTFRELVGRAREIAFDAYALQELPFETLVKKLHPVRDLARPPVFQTMLVLQNAPLGRLELPGLVLEPQAADARGAKLEMLLSLTETPNGLDGALEYNTTLFDRSTAERFLRHFGTLMESAAAHPDLPASRLPLLSAEERRQILGVWGDGGALARTDDLLHTRFQALAAMQPQAPALTWNGRDLAYGDLAARAWRLARHLRGLGVGPEVRVGVSLERSPDLMVALLAILAAGGAYVPVEPTLPVERRAFLIRDTRMPVLITRRGLLGGLPTDGVLILDPGEAATVIAGYDAAPLPPTHQTPSPDNLAYLIYTSGSTGVPKGVAIPHRSAVAFLRWAETTWSREDLAAVLAATSVSFDLSVFELFAPLSVGGKVVLVENALRLRELMGGELMEGEGVTLVNTVPSAMAEVARLGAVPASVRVVNLAGEPLRRRLANELFALGVSRVLNLYGPSEDTTYSTWAEVRSGDTTEPGIGRPIAGTRACVLDRHLEPAPVGVPGELCLAGAGLARGYLDRPDLTAERFVPDPFSAKPAARLYRTGDRARWRPDGSLEFLGRLDHQVKIRGFRIELGEIEAALLASPGIAEAAVLVREREGDRRLEAFLVAAPDAEPGLAAVRADLARRLPEHMIPQSVVFLAALPHTATGKVDRRALAEIETTPGGVRREYVPPRTEVETWLVDTCSALLGVEHVGLRDRFFDLGGHSLLATQLIARLRDAWQVDLPLQDVFSAADLGDLADRITDLGLGQAGEVDLAEALAELGVGPEDLDALLKG